ncbi:MAG: hypothetical protein FWC41_11555 [Firmicutes bacterium]|nr:hypothetical protein [Bacillota bacterium]
MDILNFIIVLLLLFIWGIFMFLIVKNIPKWIINFKNDGVPFWIGFIKKQCKEFVENWKNLFKIKNN